MTRVLIAAASAVVRAGLEALIKGRADFDVVGTASGAEALSQQIDALQPDVVLMEMERGGPVAHLVAAGDGSASPALVVLMEDSDDAGIREALGLGARAVLPRSARSEEILAAVEAAAAGLVVLHADAVESILSLLSQSRPAAPPTQQEALTHREVEVLRMLAEGAGNKTVARRLNISEHTVKFHVGSIMAKLNASSRTEAVTIGIRQGLIML